MNKFLRKNAFLSFVALVTAFIILSNSRIFVLPALAQSIEKTQMNTTPFLNFIYIVIKIVLGMSTILGLIYGFVGARECISGEKSFVAFGPSLSIFFLGFLMSISFGFIIGPLDAIILGLAILNSVFFVYFLVEAWGRSYFD